MQKLTYFLEDNLIGSRIDVALASASNISRSIIQSLIKKGMVSTVEGQKILDTSMKVKREFTVQILRPEQESFVLKKSEPQFSIVYEDDHIMVLDKPSGLVVHPGAGNTENTLVNQLVSYTDKLSSIGGPTRLGIVHRLDKDTSGLIIIAKTDEAHKVLACYMKERSICRKYYALVWGIVKNDHGDIDVNVGRSRECYKKVFAFEDKAQGKKALTKYQVLKLYNSYFMSAVRCTLSTGRTHQIRVHMNHIGHSVVGDALYGNNLRKITKYTNGKITDYLKDNFPRHALHAEYLSFFHPINGAKLTFKSPLPQDIANLITLLE